MTSVVVLDYGSGNLRSAQRALEHVGATVQVSSDLTLAKNADGLVVPGVGAFAHCVEAVIKMGADKVIDQRLARNLPVLGVCVGMQMLFSSGIEGGEETHGLDQLPGIVTKLDSPRVPHMGWNQVKVDSGSSLFAGIEDSDFYFVHSYAVQTFKSTVEPHFQSPKIHKTVHGSEFVSAIENGPLSAVQFHPEKSGDAGLHLLENWLMSIQ